MSYEIWIYENDDPTEKPWQNGSFPTEALAVRKAESIVDDFLFDSLELGMKAAGLFDLYTTFGEDPAVVGPSRFSAWDYARRRCEELCASAKWMH